MTKWKKETCLKLIEYYKKRAVLWDREHPDHGKHNTARLIWKEIGQEMGIEGQDCHKKMRCLVSNWRSLKFMVEKSKNASGEVLKPKWFGFESLSFLPFKFELRKKHTKQQNKRKRNPDTRDDSSETDTPSDLSESESNKRSDSNEDANFQYESFSSCSEDDVEQPILNKVVSIQDILIEYNCNSYFPVNVVEASDRSRISMGDNMPVTAACEQYCSLPENVVQEPNPSRISTGDVPACEGNRSLPTNVAAVPKPNQGRISTGEDTPIPVASEGSRSLPENKTQEARTNWISTREDDECRSFGVYIGNKLRNYCESKRSAIQHAVSDVIFRADQGGLNARHSQM